jgi:4'-phosphopantetheinyl transferase
MEKSCFKWICNIKNIHLDKELLCKCIARIAEDDKSRIGKFTNKNDAVSCLIGRLMIRKYATSALNISNEELVIKRDDKGRPYIQNGKPLNLKDLDFNVSHQVQFFLTFNVFFSVYSTAFFA